jgi:two-component system KDP operon response regulator KdpE
VTSVLVVDDESSMRRTLRINLTARGYTVLMAADGAAGLKAASQRPDIIVLDLGLPDMDGTDVISGIRGWSQVPIIVLSAREREADKVAALDAGADDFVTKPFGMDELLARLRAATRRSVPTSENGPVVKTPHFTIDLAAKRATNAAGEIRLTPTEWEILELLVRNAERLVASQQILTHVWGEQFHSETHYLRVYLAQLRRKLEPDPTRPRYLLTEAGMGYRFTSDELGSDVDS